VEIGSVVTAPAAATDGRHPITYQVTGTGVTVPAVRVEILIVQDAEGLPQ
jgi:hypothetical protein